MSERTYVIGLPVVVTVRGDGSVDYWIDTADAPLELWEDEEHCEEYGEAVVQADVATIAAEHDRRMEALR